MCEHSGQIRHIDQWLGRASGDHDVTRATSGQHECQRGDQHQVNVQELKVAQVGVDLQKNQC